MLLFRCAEIDEMITVRLYYYEKLEKENMRDGYEVKNVFPFVKSVNSFDERT